jgi:hypothetical protein
LPLRRRLREGKRSVVLSDIKLYLSFYFYASGSALRGRLDGKRIDVFTLDRASKAIDNQAGSYQLKTAKLRLTPDAAEILERKLGLKRALRRDGMRANSACR